jgi:hypothetical protein
MRDENNTRNSLIISMIKQILLRRKESRNTGRTGHRVITG